MNKFRWKIANMHGRAVAMRKVLPEIGLKCADCGSPAQFAVIELDEFAEHPTIKNGMPVSNRWYWCGVCELGG